MAETNEQFMFLASGGAVGCPIGALWGRLGGRLGPLEAIFGRLGAVLARAWTIVSRTEALLGPKRPMRSMLSMFHAFWEPQNEGRQIGTHMWRDSSGG
eukprot:8549074-Pyramimonas_sp.AAC.1